MEITIQEVSEPMGWQSYMGRSDLWSVPQLSKSYSNTIRGGMKNGLERQAT